MNGKRSASQATSSELMDQMTLNWDKLIGFAEKRLGKQHRGLADDVLQETALSLLQSPALGKPRHPIAYINGIIANKVRVILRNRSVERTHLENWSRNHERFYHSHLDATEVGEVLEQIRKLLSSELLDLFYDRVMGVSWGELGVKYNLPPTVLRARLRRAVGRLRDKLPASIA